MAKCGHRGPHSRTGCKPIVHENYHSAVEVRQRPVATVDSLAPFQFGLFLSGERIDRFTGDLQRPHDFVVEHASAARGDGAHRQFLLTGQAEFADDENV
jgi:hypothetical protein